jgi:hypothetical protein
VLDSFGLLPGSSDQYALAKRAEALSFKNVNIIDEDLGRSGSGLSEANDDINDH